MRPFLVFKPNTKNDAIHHNLNMVGAWFHDEGLRCCTGDCTTSAFEGLNQFGFVVV